MFRAQACSSHKNLRIIKISHEIHSCYICASHGCFYHWKRFGELWESTFLFSIFWYHSFKPTLAGNGSLCPHCLAHDRCTGAKLHPTEFLVHYGSPVTYAALLKIICRHACYHPDSLSLSLFCEKPLLGYRARDPGRSRCYGTEPHREFACHCE